MWYFEDESATEPHPQGWRAVCEGDMAVQSESRERDSGGSSSKKIMRGCSRTMGLLAILGVVGTIDMQGTYIAWNMVASPNILKGDMCLSVTF
jgi:hypothetical protein